jgi:hypothetical protein
MKKRRSWKQLIAHFVWWWVEDGGGAACMLSLRALEGN